MKNFSILIFAIITFISPFSFVNAEAMSITGLSKLSGQVGDIIEINGQNFKNVNQVFFNGIQTNIESINATKITAKVPQGTTTGFVSIKTLEQGGIVTEYKGPTFKVISDIGSFLPTKGKAGEDLVSIYGHNFIGVTDVLFNGTKAVTIENSPTEILVKVPVGATTGPITIKTTNYGDAVSSTNFTVSSGTETTTTTTTNDKTVTKKDEGSAASDASGLIPKCPDSGCGFNELMILINTIISFILVDLATPLFALIIVYAGWLYLSAGGGEENITKAKTILTNAVIGYVIVLAAWLVVKTILSALGVTNTFLG